MTPATTQTQAITFETFHAINAIHRRDRVACQRPAELPDKTVTSATAVPDAIVQDTNELFERTYPAMLRLATKVLRSESDAQDAVQAAFCRAYEHLDRFRGAASFKTWVTRIVLNECFMNLRRMSMRAVVRSVARDDESPRIDVAGRDLSPEQAALNRELHTAHNRAIDRLKPQVKAAYTLYVLSEMSLAEVAAALDITIEAAKTRIFRARRTVRKYLTDVYAGRAALRA